jgi:hypothetical protein
VGVEVAVDLAVDPSVEAAEVELLGAQHMDTQRPAEAGLEPQEVVELKQGLEHRSFLPSKDMYSLHKSMPMVVEPAEEPLLEGPPATPLWSRSWAGPVQWL